MDVITFISDSLAQVQFRLMETCKGLTQEQVIWRPVPGTNNIGFILWHMSRANDNVARQIASGVPGLWETEKWYEKFNQPIESPDPGDKMGLQSLPIPDLEVLLGYSAAVDRWTQELLKGLDPAALDRPVDPANPRRKLANSLRHAITHKNNHHGQIDYIRGLQDQTWDLPPGTGVILPETSAQPASD
jgi:uncharacterized damage-inducible protein DinB